MGLARDYDISNMILVAPHDSYQDVVTPNSKSFADYRDALKILSILSFPEDSNSAQDYEINTGSWD